MDEQRDRRRIAGAAALILVLAASACLGPPDRERARAEVGGPDGVPVQVVTSTEFVQGPVSGRTGGTRTEIISADSADRSLPVTVRQELTETSRFYIRVAMTDSTAEVAGTGPIPVQVRLFIDGEQQSAVSGDLREQPLETSFTSVSAGSVGLTGLP